MPVLEQKLRKYPISVEHAPFWSKTSQMPHFGLKYPFLGENPEITQLGAKMALSGQKLRKYRLFGENPEIIPFWAKISQLPPFEAKIPHFGRKFRNYPIFGEYPKNTPILGENSENIPFWTRVRPLRLVSLII